MKWYCIISLILILFSCDNNNNGNKNDVMLAAGALIQKYRVALKAKNSVFEKGRNWFNAVIAYKGAVAEGKRKANLVWKLYTTGEHPYTSGKNLF